MKYPEAREKRGKSGRVRADPARSARGVRVEIPAPDSAGACPGERRAKRAGGGARKRARGAHLLVVLVQIFVRVGHLSRHRLRLIVKDGFIPDDGQRLAPMSTEVRELVSVAAHSVGVHLPHAERAYSNHTVVSDFRSIVVEARLLRSGFVGARWEERNLSYSAAWANPMWDLIDAPIEAEATQILQKVTATLAVAPSLNPPWGLDDAQMATGDLPALVPARIHRFARSTYLLGRQFAIWVWSPPWEW